MSRASLASVTSSSTSKLPTPQTWSTATRVDWKIDQEVWVPHETEAYTLGTLLEIPPEGADPSDPEVQVTVQIPTEPKPTTLTLPVGHVYPVNPAANSGVPDNTMLNHLADPHLLHNIRARYSKDNIYTYTAYILIAVNPYKNLPIYDPQTLASYRNKSIGIMPPHIFAVADRSYRSMRAEKKSQCVLISGESGAGKTESSKFVLHFLASISAGVQAPAFQADDDEGEDGSAAIPPSSGSLEDKILQTNPILEAFGNAKTLRNNNSSRFGKMMKIHFDPAFRIAGGAIETYLLEKSRVIRQATNERNYHIFYQLTAGASPEERKTFDLGPAESYAYLANSGIFTATGMDDAAEYKRTRAGMTAVGITAEQQEAALSIVAAVLHLGNIEFADEEDAHDDAVKINDAQPLASAARLLGVSEDALTGALTKRTVTAGRDSMLVPLKKPEAERSRDALAKQLYGRLFDWLVAAMNRSLACDTNANALFIGVLDIFGFEYFQRNSFEQLCINLTNERLQQHFNEAVLRQEQDIYSREGIKWDKIDYVDNQNVIDLIAGREGILSILDEECSMPKRTDKTFGDTISQKHGKNTRSGTQGSGSRTSLGGARDVGGGPPGPLLTPRQAKIKEYTESEAFVVRHFAADVCYQTEGFLEKNQDTLTGDLESLIANSSNDFVAKIAAVSAAAGGRPGRKRIASIGKKFNSQLEKLMTLLASTNSHFVRCVKPNDEQTPGKITGSNVMTQLRCSGMLETLRLMQIGFPTRCTYDDLYGRYNELMPDEIKSLDAQSFCEALLMAMEVPRSQFQLGITKVFFRAGQLAFLEELTGSDWRNLAPEITRKVRLWLRWKKVRRVWYTVRANVRLAHRLRLMRAGRRFAKAAVFMLYVSYGLLPRAYRARQKVAVRHIEATWLGYKARTEYQTARRGVIALQSYVRRRQVYREYAPLLAELKEERLEMEAQRREDEKRRKAEDRERRKRELTEKTRAKIDRAHAAHASADAAASKAAEAAVAAVAAGTAVETATMAFTAATASGGDGAPVVPAGAVAVDGSVLEELRKELQGLREQVNADAERWENRVLMTDVRHRQLCKDVEDLKAELERERTARRELEKALSGGRGDTFARIPLVGSTSGSLSRQQSVTSVNTEGAVPDSPSTPVRAENPSSAAARRRRMSTDALRNAPDGASRSPMDLLKALSSAYAPAASTTAGTGKKIRAPPKTGASLLLDRAVIDVATHMSGQLKDKSSPLGNDSRDPEIVNLIRGNLCTALAKVMYHGFNPPFRFFGRYHVWDMMLDFARRNTGADSSGEVTAEARKMCEMVRFVDTLLGSSPVDIKLRSWVCHALNKGKLAMSIAVLAADDGWAGTWYEESSYIRYPAARTNIIACLENLDKFHFELAVDFELTNWDL